MGSGTSRSSLTRDECKQRVGEDKWDKSWDEFYFADGKSVSSELAERVWCKAEALDFSATIARKRGQHPPGRTDKRERLDVLNHEVKMAEDVLQEREDSYRSARSRWRKVLKRRMARKVKEAEALLSADVGGTDSADAVDATRDDNEMGVLRGSDRFCRQAWIRFFSMNRHQRTVSLSRTRGRCGARY